MESESAAVQLPTLLIWCLLLSPAHQGLHRFGFGIGQLGFSLFLLLFIITQPVFYPLCTSLFYMGIPLFFCFFKEILSFFAFSKEKF